MQKNIFIVVLIIIIIILGVKLKNKECTKKCGCESEIVQESTTKKELNSILSNTTSLQYGYANENINIVKKEDIEIIMGIFDSRVESEDTDKQCIEYPLYGKLYNGENIILTVYNCDNETMIFEEKDKITYYTLNEDVINKWINTYNNYK